MSGCADQDWEALSSQVPRWKKLARDSDEQTPAGDGGQRMTTAKTAAQRQAERKARELARNTQPGEGNMDANALIAAKAAISTLERTGLMTPRAAKAARKALRAKISEAIAYWGDKGQDDIVEGLNDAYRAILP